MYDSAEEDGKLLGVHCWACGSLIGQAEAPAGKAGFHCPKCKQLWVVCLKDGGASFHLPKRSKKTVPNMI